MKDIKRRISAIKKKIGEIDCLDRKTEKLLHEVVSCAHKFSRKCKKGDLERIRGTLKDVQKLLLLAEKDLEKKKKKA